MAEENVKDSSLPPPEAESPSTGDTAKPAAHDHNDGEVDLEMAAHKAPSKVATMNSRIGSNVAKLKLDELVADKSDTMNPKQGLKETTENGSLEPASLTSPVYPKGGKSKIAGGDGSKSGTCGEATGSNATPVEPIFDPEADIQPQPIPPAKRVLSESLPGAYALGGHIRPVIPRSQLQMDAEQSNYYENNGVLPQRLQEDGEELERNEDNPAEVELEAVLAATVVDEEEDSRQLQPQQQQEPHQDLPRDIEEVGELIEATSMPEEKFLVRYQKLACALLLLFVAGGVATVVGMIVSRPNQSSSGASSSQSIGPVIYPPFQDDLPAVTVKDMEDMLSPQYRANVWMWNDPHLKEYSKDCQLQRFALAMIFLTTGGAHWHNNDYWLDYEVSECLWYTSSTTGSVCDDQGNFLIADLSSNNLTGTILREAQYVPYYTHIDLGNNQIGGTFPPWAASDTLEVFVLSNNNLEGPIVGEAGFSAPKLRVVKIDGNSVVGNHPYLYYVLPAMEIFNTSQNPIGGSIPSTIKAAKHLQYLSFRSGNYEGLVPSELGLLSDLEVYDFADNPLVVGTVPMELGMLKNLTLFDISNTSITGALPNEFCNRTAAAGYKPLTIVANCSMVQCCG